MMAPPVGDPVTGYPALHRHAWKKPQAGRAHNDVSRHAPATNRGGILALSLKPPSPRVTPAQAGVQNLWIPACAGETLGHSGPHS